MITKAPNIINRMGSCGRREGPIVDVYLQGPEFHAVCLVLVQAEAEGVGRSEKPHGS